MHTTLQNKKMSQLDNKFYNISKWLASFMKVVKLKWEREKDRVGLVLRKEGKRRIDEPGSGFVLLGTKLNEDPRIPLI